ncbi:phospholipase A [Psychrobacter sp. AOP7-B1-25]|uniref:phospholipase A n=1 Tax=Psychrobacter sp. AOP7-B1-25 TaxID=3457644 RepID=UPI00402B561C
MFAHTITQRQHQPSYQNANMPLRIAVALALSCTAIQVQAADDSQTYNELPAPEAAFEYEDLDLSQDLDNNVMSSNVSTQSSKIISKEFIAKQAELFSECTQVQSSAARLACFDKVAEQGKTPSYTTTKQPVDLAKTFQSTISGNPKVILAESQTEMSGTTVENADTILMTNQQSAVSKLQESDSVEVETDTKTEAQILENVGVTQTDIEKFSPLSLSYDLDQNSERGTWTVRPYRPTYLLPLFYTLDPNLSPSTPSQEAEPFDSNDIRETELKFQLSLKTKVAEDLFDTSADLWFGYTQESHWQVYNEDNSRPFRATDYQPEIFLTQPVTADLPFGGRLRMLGAGAVHHSNGQDDPLSRSWNRAYLMAGAEWGKLSVIPRLWTRVNNESSSDDDNPDIEDYMGYGDIKFLYDLSDQQSISGTLRYNPSTNKGAAQIDYIYPISDNVNGMVQLFQGYGESIIDYNHENTSIGFGIVLNDWKGI